MVKGLTRIYGSMKGSSTHTFVENSFYKELNYLNRVKRVTLRVYNYIILTLSSSFHEKIS